MDVGLTYYPEDIVTTVARAKAAERLGFDSFGIVDSHLLFCDVYGCLAAAARETDSIDVGPTVTNPVTRHPTVTASAISTVHAQAPGRVFLGLGSGDSSVFTIGEKPASLADIERAVETIRTARGEPPPTETVPDHLLRWLDGVAAPGEVPIHLAAEGPKTLELAGRIADAVIVGLGVSPEVVGTALAHLDRGLASAGRTRDDVEIWIGGHANVADSRERAVEELETSIAASIHHSLQFTMEGKAVPEAHREPFKRVVREYEPREHAMRGVSTNKTLVGRLPAATYRYAAGRYAIAGTPEDCIEVLCDLGGIEGVDGVRLQVQREREGDLIARFGEDVLPAL